MLNFINLIKKYFIFDNEFYSLYDKTVINVIVILLSISIVMIYSASIAYASEIMHGQYHFLMHHIISIAISSLVAYLVFNIPSKYWHRHANTITIIILFLLFCVLVPHLGRSINGSKRWLGIGFLGVQPSEFAKLGIVIFLAKYLTSKKYLLNQLSKDFIPMLAVLLLYIILLIFEPDMGTATVVFIIALALFYLSDISRRFIICCFIFGIVTFVFLIIIEPYRIRRVLGFMHPWEDAFGKGYQLTHSLLAFGHGGWFGVGIGNSIEKLFYLPEAHTDFILSIVAEETGVLGVLCILALFIILFYRGFSVIAVNARNIPNRKFQAMLAQGISIWFLVQTLINMGVTLGILPTKGLTLPFISYGGSSLMINAIAFAILLRIDYENRCIKYGIMDHA